MTDITELAQSLKAAAIDAKELAIIARYSKGRAAAEKFYALANPNNVIALVEALEKAQQVDEELCKLLPPGAEYMDPPDGGDVTPIEGVRRMVADYRQRTAELDAVLEREREKSRRVMSRIADLESHKAALLKFVRDSCYVFDGTDEDISDAYVDAITSGLMPKLESVAACNPPLFWVRVKSDGGYEGPIHDSKLEYVRKNSGEWLPLTLARGVPEREPRTVTPVNYSDNTDADHCRKWAWQQVKGEVSTEGWTSGDNANYFGFFCWGWDMRRQYNEQRPINVKLPKTMYTEFDGDDYCREVAVLDKQQVIDCLRAAGIKVEAE